MSTQAWVTFTLENQTMEVVVGGHWQATNISQVYQQMLQAKSKSMAQCKLDVSGILSIDTTGAWVLKNFLDHCAAQKSEIKLVGASKTIQHLFSQLGHFKIAPASKIATSHSFIIRWLNKLGFVSIGGVKNAANMLSFLGEILITLGQTIIRPKRFRFTSLVAMMEAVGLKAVPIVALLSFLLGIVIVYQGQYQLKRFGAEIFAVDLLAISMFREIGVLITAIVIAGRSGSAFTAQIGTMKLNQEIDALQTFGINPIEVLVIPRLLALLLTLPLLTFLSDLAGLLGGALIANLVIDIPYTQFIQQLKQAVQPWTIWVGMIKAPAFAFIIAMVGCFEGMQVSGGAASIGRRTTKSVVEGIFLVVVLNAIFSIMFTLMGI